MKIKTYRFAAAVAVLLALCLVFMAPVGAEDKYVVPSGITWSDPNVVAATTDNGNTFTYYTTLLGAVNAVNGNDAILYCKPNADLSTMTHGLVTANLTVYGNDAYISGGERDFAVESTVEAAKLTRGDTTIHVERLNAAVWGARTSSNTLNIEFKDCNNVQRIYITSIGSDLTKVDKTATVNINVNNCTFDGDATTAYYKSNTCTIFNIYNGEITVTGSTFTGVDEPINLNHKVSGLQTVSVSECDFVNCGAENHDWEAPIRVLSSDVGGSSQLTVDDCSFTETLANSINQNADILLDYGVGVTSASISGTAANVILETASNVGTPVSVVYTESKTFTNAVAQIEDTYYGTLAEAVGAATVGDTITLLKDVNLGTSGLTIGKSITLDLNSNEISGSPTDLITVNNGALVEIKNGTVKNLKSSNSAYAIYGNNATVTLTDVSVEAISTGKAYAFYLSAKNLKSGQTVGIVNGNTQLLAPYAITVYTNKTNPMPVKLTVNDGVVVSSASYGIAGNGDGDNTVITINGGSITGTNAAGIYHPQDGDLTINSGTITGSDGIQFVGSGNLTINGGTINGINSTVIATSSIAANSNGAEPSGAAVAIVNTAKEAYGTKPVIVKINGGTFLSEKNDALRVYGNVSNVMTDGNMKSGSSISIIGGLFSSQPDASYIKSGYEVVSSDGKYKVQEKKQVTTTTTTTSSKPKEEPPVEEPETPVEEPEAGEPTVETEVTDGGEVVLETPVEEPAVGEDGAVAADDEAKITGVVLPTGTDSEVTFIPISEQPAPAGKETSTKKVFEINVPTYEKGKPATVKFQMTVAELEADGKEAADVALWHFDEETGEWTKLLTSYIIVDGIVYFEAITYDFSPFAIIYEETPVDEPVEEPETPESPAPVLGLLAALGAAVVLRRK